eukprot:3125733-Pleurochrysis_carterae.AAC.1
MAVAAANGQARRTQAQAAARTSSQWAQARDHALARTHGRTHGRACAHACASMRARAHTPTHARAHTLTHECSHTKTHTRILARARTHTRTRAHAQTRVRFWLPCCPKKSFTRLIVPRAPPYPSYSLDPFSTDPLRLEHISSPRLFHIPQ